ncbi:MAG: D-alanine--D-alanine ligase [Bacteroidota bacterium]|nr:D-alanine--D-alanine ligase [Bacteroidota bacterium]
MNVAVVMGGYSQESDISIKSGQLIINNLDSQKYNVFEVHILKEGWFLIHHNQQIPLNKADFSVMINQQKIEFDVVVNTIHGTPGEDGQLQAYWKLLGMPYTGCDFYQSALTFNKRDTLSVLSKYDVPKAKSIYLNQGDEVDIDHIVNTLGLPLFVKANRSGSSFGVYKVSEAKDLLSAVNQAFEIDNQVLIEASLVGREMSVGVIKKDGVTTVVGVTEIISENDFFDYDAKYKGKAKEVTPADISEEIYNKIELLTIKIYNTLEMRGFSRIDYIIQDGEPYFIEINTNPGLSPASIFPQQVAYRGWRFSELLDSEINQAIAVSKEK